MKIVRGIAIYLLSPRSVLSERLNFTFPNIFHMMQFDNTNFFKKKILTLTLFAIIPNEIKYTNEARLSINLTDECEMQNKHSIQILNQFENKLSFTCLQNTKLD